MRAALVRVAGYKQMKANVSTQQVQVEYDPGKTNPEALAKAITTGAGFKSSVISKS